MHLPNTLPERYRDAVGHCTRFLDGSQHNPIRRRPPPLPFTGRLA